jgi:dihydroneopterin aldolase/2-amino-4-hydroxy-6-hydroxymethyldihydropteridine diphosphokinase/dihydropteroate synthase
VRVSVSVPHDLRLAAAGDDISKSINYGSLSKRILASVEDPSSEFGSLEHFLDHIFLTCFGAFPEIREMSIDVVKPRALPYAEGVRILSSRARDGSRLAPDCLSIQRLSCNLIVGLNPCEREDKQLVYFDVDISALHEAGNGFDFRRLAKEIHQVRPFDGGHMRGSLSQSGGRVVRVRISGIAGIPNSANHSSSR